MTGENRGRPRRRAYDAPVRAPLAGLVWLAACYTPEIATGVPCAPNGRCPEGQSCMAGVCGVPGLFDAAIDTPPPDKDGDGRPDMVDNCRDDPNPDQENEDNDAFGDACDPCPVFADVTVEDPDHDNISNACDPNPMLSGDRIETFESFHHGLPATWMPQTGTWTAGSDAIRIDAPAETPQSIVVPTSATDHIQVFASVTIETVASAVVHFFEVSLPNDQPRNLGIGCQVVQTGMDAGTRYLSLWDGLDPATNLPPRPSGVERGQAQFMWKEGITYVVSLKRIGTSYTCRVTSPDGAVPLEANGSSSLGASVASPTVVLRARSLAAHVNWVMVIRSP
jgi:hypothetical protein